MTLQDQHSVSAHTCLQGDAGSSILMISVLSLSTEIAIHRGKCRGMGLTCALQAELAKLYLELPSKAHHAPPVISLAGSSSASMYTFLFACCTLLTFFTSPLPSRVFRILVTCMVSLLSLTAWVHQRECRARQLLPCNVQQDSKSVDWHGS